jgi:hypothetical protein
VLIHGLIAATLNNSLSARLSVGLGMLAGSLLFSAYTGFAIKNKFVRYGGGGGRGFTRTTTTSRTDDPWTYWLILALQLAFTVFMFGFSLYALDGGLIINGILIGLFIAVAIKQPRWMCGWDGVSDKQRNFRDE